MLYLESPVSVGGIHQLPVPLTCHSVSRFSEGLELRGGSNQLLTPNPKPASPLTDLWVTVHCYGKSCLLALINSSRICRRSLRSCSLFNFPCPILNTTSDGHNSTPRLPLCHNNLSFCILSPILTKHFVSLTCFYVVQRL